MDASAISRLVEERKFWRKNKPFGFTARPSKNEDGTLNLMNWDCIIPGKKGTSWEGGNYKLKMVFSSYYPRNPPHCFFTSKIFHPNIFASGSICLSILHVQSGWERNMTVKQILLCIQDFLDKPNPQSPANYAASSLFQSNRVDYEQKIREQAKAMSSLD